MDDHGFQRLVEALRSVQVPIEDLCDFCIAGDHDECIRHLCGGDDEPCVECICGECGGAELA